MRTGCRGVTVFLAMAFFLALAVIFASDQALAQRNDTYRVVAIPPVENAPICAEDKASLVSKAAAAQADAAENAQIATRHFAEIQASARAGNLQQRDVDLAARERDQRLDEARRAFAALDQATRLSEKACPAAGTAAAAPQPAPPPPAAPSPANSAAQPPSNAVAEKAPASAESKTASERSGVSLALSLAIPDSCKPGSVCPMMVDVHNRGSQPLPSPFLVAFALGSEGAQIGNILPDSWSCGQASESLTCSGAGPALAPGGSARLSVDWRVPERPRRPSATVCARIVWPARGKDGVYRSEQIAAIQFALQKAGFDPGGYDGRLGSKTVDAIRAFRARAGIEGPTELTGDFLNALFGSNGSLSGDDNAADDSTCVAVSFGPQPVAAAPAAASPVTVVTAPANPAIEAAPTPPEQPRLAPAPTAPAKQAAPREPRRRQQAAPANEPRRVTARRAPADDDDDDRVVVYTQPPRRPPPGAGPRPVIVYPDGSYRRWGDPTIYRQ